MAPCAGGGGAGMRADPPRLVGTSQVEVTGAEVGQLGHRPRRWRSPSGPNAEVLLSLEGAAVFV